MRDVTLLRKRLMRGSRRAQEMNDEQARADARLPMLAITPSPPTFRRRMLLILCAACYYVLRADEFFA